MSSFRKGDPENPYSNLRQKQDNWRHKQQEKHNREDYQLKDKECPLTYDPFEQDDDRE